MENISNTVKMESLKSFQSTIGKLEKALAQMTEQGKNTTLINKRLNALYVGLAMLENTWHHKPHEYSQKELAIARTVLIGLFLSIESAYAKSKTGSPQSTLLERRIRALELAVQAIEEGSDK